MLKGACSSRRVVRLVACLACELTACAAPALRERSLTAPATSTAVSATSATWSSGGAASVPRTATQRAARGVLRVCTTGDYAPFTERDAANVRRGFDVDLATTLAPDLGYELVWVDVTWPTLTAALTAHRCDVAMSGVTWTPARSVKGFMTRAVGRGGPCVLGDTHAMRVGVNHGGELEAWARQRWPESTLVIVDANQRLPDLLRSASVGAVVTDSFERQRFADARTPVSCEPPLARKVYWVSPRHQDLKLALDGWLKTHGDVITAAQLRWFGERQALRPIDHLVDLLARRLAFMPLVAGAKAKRGLAIDDPAREKIVLDSAAESARRTGLPAAWVRKLFALQIELAKAVQHRQSEPNELDLGTDLRAALNELGDRILDAVVEARSELASATANDLELTSPWLTDAERRLLLDELHALGQGAAARPRAASERRSETDPLSIIESAPSSRTFSLTRAHLEARWRQPSAMPQRFSTDPGRAAITGEGPLKLPLVNPSEENSIFPESLSPQQKQDLLEFLQIL